MTTQKKVLIAILICLPVIYFVAFRVSSGKRYAPGIIVPTVPQQLKLEKPRVWRKGKYQFTALAEFNLKARVLSTETYWFDEGADISPVDFALGWGIMSDQKVLDELSISQTGRWYYWNSSGEPPISPEEITAFSSNMHIIPKTDAVNTLIKRVGKGDIIELRGFLVEITRDDGFTWKSSLSRTDTGAGACEVVLVEEIYINK